MKKRVWRCFFSTDMWAKFKFEERLQKKLRLGMNCYNIRIV
jgi:hypothetical protein